MKKFILLLCLLPNLGVAQRSAHAQDVHNSSVGELSSFYQSPDAQVLAKYVRSLLPAIGLGFISGKLSGMCVHDRQSTLVTAIIWLMEAHVRHLLLRNLAKDFNEYGVTADENIMLVSGWATSWLAYLNQRGYLW